MGRILVRDLASPSRAVLALEAAHAIDSNDPVLLADLDRLYDALGRFADRARTIEERIACSETPDEQLATLQGEIARIAVKIHFVDFRNLAGIPVNSLQPAMTVVYAMRIWANNKSWRLSGSADASETHANERQT